jgi:hypothetical protein
LANTTLGPVDDEEFLNGIHIKFCTQLYEAVYTQYLVSVSHSHEVLKEKRLMSSE